MTVRIFPSRGEGRVVAPPSKSMAHRALIVGSLSESSTVTNVAYSKDIEATLGCLQALGATVERREDTVRLGGLNMDRVPPNAALFCNESGSTLRFFVPLCWAAGVPVTLTGSERLFERPLTVYENIARQQGLTLTKHDDRVTLCGPLSSGAYTVAGDISSQFITGLLLTLPLLAGDSTVSVTGRFESASYVDLTLSALSAFGVTVTRDGQRFYIPGGQRPVSRTYRVEGDCSNAAFLEALNLLGGAVQVDGLAADTLQGDRVYREIFDGLRTGMRVFDLSDCPDLAPVAFAMAAVSGGGVFTGTARLRIKESDRGIAMAQELDKFGVKVTVEENRVIVHEGILRRPAVPLWGHNDHRIVMALTLLCTKTGGIIEGAEAVNKSYPGFFETMTSLGIGLEQL